MQLLLRAAAQGLSLGSPRLVATLGVLVFCVRSVVVLPGRGLRRYWGELPVEVTLPGLLPPCASAAVLPGRGLWLLLEGGAPMK